MLDSLCNKREKMLNGNFAENQNYDGSKLGRGSVPRNEDDLKF